MPVSLIPCPLRFLDTAKRMNRSGIWAPPNGGRTGLRLRRRLRAVRLTLGWVLFSDSYRSPQGHQELVAGSLE
jgi:hypothetical protein